MEFFCEPINEKCTFVKNCLTKYRREAKPCSHDRRSILKLFILDTKTIRCTRVFNGYRVKLGYHNNYFRWRHRNLVTHNLSNLVQICRIDECPRTFEKTITIRKTNYPIKVTNENGKWIKSIKIPRQPVYRRARCDFFWMNTSGYTPANVQVKFHQLYRKYRRVHLTSWNKRRRNRSSLPGGIYCTVADF